MKCGKCGFEPRNDLLRSPCQKCLHHWVDTFDYVELLAMTDELAPKLEHHPKVVLDIGCGLKGVIAQHVWEGVIGIERGYACDLHVIKELPSVWKPLKIDAADLCNILGPNSIDFTTHCGMLEHVDYAHALNILHVIEMITRDRVFFTCSTVMREVDYKVKHDGNPFHYYKSFWDARTFELLGYNVDRQRMHDGRTFSEEVTCWFDPDDILRPWEMRIRAAINHITYRRCSVPKCNCEPAWWDASSSLPDGSDDKYWCLIHANDHHMEEDHLGKPLTQWYENENKLKLFQSPPWRDRLPLLCGI